MSLLKSRSVLIGFVAVLNTPDVAFAQYACENLASDTVITGEMRYETNSGTDDCYSNQYWDGPTSDELDLQCGLRPGATSGSNTAFYGSMVVHEDYTSGDGSNVLFTYRLRELSAFTCTTNNCINQTVLHSHTATLRINSTAASGTCSGSACNISAGRMIGISHTGAGMDSWGDVDTASGCNTDDLGCFITSSSSCDELVNF